MMMWTTMNVTLCIYCNHNISILLCLYCVLIHVLLDRTRTVYFPSMCSIVCVVQTHCINLTILATIFQHTNQPFLITSLNFDETACKPLWFSSWRAVCELCWTQLRLQTSFGFPVRLHCQTWSTKLACYTAKQHLADSDNDVQHLELPQNCTSHNCDVISQ